MRARGFGGSLIARRFGLRTSLAGRLLAGGIVFYITLFFHPPEAGWWSYPPLSSIQFSPNGGQDAWIFLIHLTGISSLLGAINFYATIVNMRAPGMSWGRLPLFIWAILVYAILLIIALPVVAAAVTMLLTDRHFGTHWFDPTAHGSPILWQHLFWFFGHPEVYIMVLPGFGIISEVIPVFSRKPIFGYKAMAASIAVIAFLATLVWAHHMFASPIPIVFITGFDPVGFGLVASMNRPGGNVVGVNTLVGELSGKQLGLLHDLVPKAATIAVLFDPRQTSAEAIILPDARDAAAALGQKLLVLQAGTAEEIDAQFTRLDREPADAMFVTVSPFFLTRAGQIAALAARHRMPAIYVRREFAEAGGLMSYGYTVAELYRDSGRYAGRILNGEKPADLPIIQPTKFELVINLKAAKALSFEFPPLIRALADEVIE